MKITLHQTRNTIADFDGILGTIKETITPSSEGVHVFPELYLCGYPLQDLVLQKPFISAYIAHQKKLVAWLKKNMTQENLCLLFGGLEYDLSKTGMPISIRNVIYKWESGSGFHAIYTKRLLPNYDIFDEKKYFTSGHEPKFLEVQGKKLGLLICEDMWASAFYDIDPVSDMFKDCEKESLDAIVNLSASPYILGKHQKRIDRAQYISNLFNCPFYYVNKVGGEDEILFDGASFVVAGDNIIAQAPLYEKCDIEIESIPPGTYSVVKPGNKDLSWEDLFNSRLDFAHSPSKLHTWTDQDCAEIFKSLTFGFQEYATKNGFNKFTVALSGGVDSALVLALIRLSLTPDQQLEAIYMPSIHSSPLSYDLCLDICENLSVPVKTLPIKFLHSTAKNLFTSSYSDSFEGLTDENVQSRLRGMLLYTRSNQKGSMVVNTSNKSELAVGYSTQYGDSVGAISLLGDLYKSEVYRLCEYINKTYNQVIPEKIITREPTAELREGQVDTDSLPAYEILDGILEGLLNYRYTKKDLEDLGFSKDDVETTFHLYRRNEYKRYQFCPIIKISSKSFGFGYRIPLSKNTDFYLK